jgi:hypothetical protein
MPHRYCTDAACSQHSLRHSAAQALSLACPVLFHPHVTLYETAPTLIHMHPFRVDQRTHADVFRARTLTFRVVLSVSVAHAL